MKRLSLVLIAVVLLIIRRQEPSPRRHNNGKRNFAYFIRRLHLFFFLDADKKCLFFIPGLTDCLPSVAYLQLRHEDSLPAGLFTYIYEFADSSWKWQRRRRRNVYGESAL